MIRTLLATLLIPAFLLSGCVVVPDHDHDRDRHDHRDNDRPPPPPPPGGYR
ncbi:hypothetical protein [Bordetella sp. N]|uniref:hypothetical protein n=1 Tax=Bordetella sp. N TaxID=1746199 RepID=UPI000AAFA5E0|nr:hypothetical protein [Bordetella sp. N]